MAGDRGGELRDYLGRAFAENRPWDQIFRDLMLADETDPSRKGAVGVPQGAGRRTSTG